jgi:hypothetical protein
MSEDTIVVHESLAWGPDAAWPRGVGRELALVAALVGCLRATGRARRAQQRARASAVPGAPLEEGQRFVAGTVELASGESTAVRVTVKQVGAQRAVKNGHLHDWTEVAREVVARPFYLTHASGERVRVEPPPGDGVLLVDRLDLEEWTEREERRKRAELTAGEAAFVEGRLERGHDPEGGSSAGYRDAALGWVLRPRRGVLAVSTEPLEHRHELRLRALDRLFRVLLVAVVAAQAPLATFWMRAFAGVDTVVAYAGKRTYSTRDSRGRSTRHEVVDHEVPGVPGVQATEVAHWAYEELPAGPGRMALRFVPGVPVATAIGRGASIGTLPWLAAVAVGAFALRRYARVTRHKRWYERPLVEKGRSGALPDPPGTRFPS